MKQDFIDLVFNQKVATATFILDDIRRLRVQGIIKSVRWNFAESSPVNGQYAIEGRPTLV